MQTLFALLTFAAIYSLGLGFADAARDHGFWFGTSVDNTSQPFRAFFKQRGIKRWAIFALIIGILGSLLTV
ncbi:hypothetical protein [Hymenobacter terricola]|uniref:hypothetical protein n=1 Tax=Hymenobacter terricola TaxID=2819236 RepID=UPI001B30BC9F|nr:hypothetical protein [Hymenobacter terricola]